MAVNGIHYPISSTDLDDKYYYQICLTALRSSVTLVISLGLAEDTMDTILE
jgi:hypothetical protein